MKERFDSFCNKLVDRLTAYKAAMGLTYFDEYRVVWTEGKKFYKVQSQQLKNGGTTGQSNLIAFVDKVTGDIYKPASWVAPAKHARGNINSEQNGMEAITPEGNVIYLR